MKKVLFLLSSLTIVHHTAKSCALDDFIPKEDWQITKEKKRQKKATTRELCHKRSLEDFLSLDLQPNERISYFPGVGTISKEFNRRYEAMPEEFKKIKIKNPSDEAMSKYGIPNDTGLYLERAYAGFPEELLEGLKEFSANNPEEFGELLEKFHTVAPTCMHLSYMGLTYKIWFDTDFNYYKPVIRRSNVRFNFNGGSWMYAYKSPSESSTCVIERKAVPMSFEYHSPGIFRIWPITPYQGNIRIPEELRSRLPEELQDLIPDEVEPGFIWYEQFPLFDGLTFYGVTLGWKDNRFLIEDFPIIFTEGDA